MVAIISLIVKLKHKTYNNSYGKHISKKKKKKRKRKKIKGKNENLEGNKELFLTWFTQFLYLQISGTLIDPKLRKKWSHLPREEVGVEEKEKATLKLDLKFGLKLTEKSLF